jgi:hypothetical protein
MPPMMVRKTIGPISIFIAVMNVVPIGCMEVARSGHFQPSTMPRLPADRQALLVLAHLRCGHTYAQLAAGFGVGTSTVHRYVAEAVEVLAALAPDLATAVRAAARKAFVILDGTLLPIDRIAADRPYYSGKHKKHGMNVQVIADPFGRLLWASAVIGHAGLAEEAVAAGPPLGRRGRDLEAFSSPAQGPAVLDDAAGQAQTAGLGQGCITVRQEGLLGARWRCRNPHRSRKALTRSRAPGRAVRHQPPWTEHLGQG